MPSDGLFGLGSGYVSHTAGDFRAWILDEIPELAAMAIDAVSPEAPLALAGLSMGGFGALLLGARNGDRVRAVAGMSSITDFSQMRFFVGDISGLRRRRTRTRSVLDAMIANRDRLPAIHFDCGETDPLIEPNRALHAALGRRGNRPRATPNIPAATSGPTGKATSARRSRFAHAFVRRRRGPVSPPASADA